MHPFFGSNRSLMTLFVVWSTICISIAAMLIQLAEPFQIVSPISSISLLTIPWYFFLLFFCISNYYLCVRLPANRYTALQLLAIHSLAAAITIGLWMLLGWSWARALAELNTYEPSVVYAQSQMINTIIGLLLYGIWVLIHYTYLMAKGDHTENADALAQKLLISNIELQTIKASVHPHFMYNSLNMLANLSIIAPDKIHDKCVQMSEFLRYSVNYSKNELVTIEEELNHVKNYLAIERERFGEGLEVFIEVDNNALGQPAMPLLLFPLIENAIKHGIQSHAGAGFIKISIKQNQNSIDLCVSNSYDPTGNKAQSTKHGLASLKKRLQSYYGPGSRFNAEQTDEVYSVALSLPFLTRATALPQRK